jgi:predicted amidophosphoribosyltransferase
VLAAFAYERTARRLILDLKLTAARACAAPLARGMADQVMRCGLYADAITWVPGRRADIRKRGFDHAAVLARAVASLLGLPTRALLHRTGSSQDQAGLSRRERFRNLQGAFAAHPCHGRVALVDDLFTTGATAGACTRALLVAGSQQVEVLVAARV